MTGNTLEDKHISVPMHTRHLCANKPDRYFPTSNACWRHFSGRVRQTAVILFTPNTAFMRRYKALFSMGLLIPLLLPSSHLSFLTPSLRQSKGHHVPAPPSSSSLSGFLSTADRTKCWCKAGTNKAHSKCFHGTFPMILTYRKYYVLNLFLRKHIYIVDSGGGVFHCCD